MMFSTLHHSEHSNKNCIIKAQMIASFLLDSISISPKPILTAQTDPLSTKIHPLPLFLKGKQAVFLLLKINNDLITIGEKIKAASLRGKTASSL